MSGWADTSTSAAIQSEICRFESVHPNIYAVYELLQLIDNSKLQNQIREHIINVEDSFVNSQEWTLSRRVLELRVAVIGGLRSGKSALVHRYLTGSYVNDESPEGGRFKKEVNVEGESHLLLIRDEAGHPDVSLCSWADGVLLVFSLADEESFRLVTEYSRRFSHSRPNLPLFLIGTQDALGARSPRVIDDSRARKLAHDLNGEYIETCATYGMNVDKAFVDAADRILKSKNYATNQNSTKLGVVGPNHNPSPNNHSSGHPNKTRLSTTPLRTQAASRLQPPANDMGESSDGSSNTPASVQRKPNRHRRKSAKTSIFGRSSKTSDKGSAAASARSIVVLKKGYVQKRSRTGTSLREFKKKFLTLTEDGLLGYFASESDFNDERECKSVDVGRCSIKVPGRSGQPCSNESNNSEFTVVSSVTGDHWVFSCESLEQRDEWVQMIEKMIKSTLSCGSLTESVESRSIGSMGSQLNFDRPGNKSCADCHMPAPTWASLNLGILICIECSGIHRNLGAHVSRVRSVELDEWSQEHKAMLQAVGNNLSNSVFEANIGTRVKPCPNSDRLEKENWIKEKYVHKTFISSIRIETTPETICDCVNRHDVALLIRLLAFSTPADLSQGHGPRQDTPLHVAAFKGDLVSLQLLLWSRASARVVNANNQSPIDIAAQRGHHLAVRLLNVSAHKWC